MENNMHEFEKFLVDNNFLICRSEGKDQKARMVKVDVHDMSTLGGKENSYMYVPIKSKHYKALSEGKYVPASKFTPEEFNDIIVFGFEAIGKPPTLLQPRPNIRVKTTVNCHGLLIEHVALQDECDAMLFILAKHTPKAVFEAIYDREIVLS